MAAYAALVSVMHIIEQIENHPLPPISLNKKHVESLTKKVIFLQEFLEGYAPIGKNEGNGLESRILDVAYAAEDVIESHIVDRILARSASSSDPGEFRQRLMKVLEDMDLIKNEAMEMKEKMGVQHQMQRNLTSAYIRQKQNTTMVGFDDALLEILDKLTGGGLNRQFIPIVGMGGMGKTTLVRNVYAHPLIREHFDILAWSTISQEYDAWKILNEILSQANEDKGNSSENNEKQIGDDLYKYLFGRKYLIVMDDMWSVEAWDKIKFFFPDNNNGSRIVVTTRLSNLARRLSNYSLPMRFLDFDESWDLFSKIVFSGDGYPLEMVETGKKIVGNCRGLPLSIVVVGGFLAKSEYKREYWEYIDENLFSVVNSDNDEHCLKILQLSYNQLPVHLKPCFLYMGVFKEDSEIHISNLVKLWVAEGFLKPVRSKDLEEVAKDYLNELVDRNLIYTVKSRRKCVKIHDLLRDLCSRQAQAERFYSIITQRSVTIPHSQRRFIVSEATLEEEVLDALLSVPFARSMICYTSEIYPSPDHRLLRVCGACDEAVMIDDYFYFQENKIQLVNLRYLAAYCIPWDSKFATSLHLLWSLQTLIIEGDYCDGFIAPTEIWYMPQLRHVQVLGYLRLPDPPVCNGQDGIVLENLQTLMLVRNFKCGEEVVKRIPNIKKLRLVYAEEEVEESYLENLVRLDKLKSFYCTSFPYPEPDGTDFLMKLSFPRSLKKLAIYASHVHWEDILEKIGSLPLLQKLELGNGFFTARTWETVEGQFSSLKYLKIDSCEDIEYWNSETSHFPRLEQLVLRNLDALNEIPSGVGEIPTLRSIELYYCSKSSVISCKSIQEEQEELYGEEEVTLRVRVQLPSWDYDALQDLASPNFELIQ